MPWLLAAVDELPDLLLRTILPDYDAEDWAAYPRWVRTLPE